jgi:hypothetical protein
MGPFVFIVGCPRSGTTLLQRILDAHPRIAVTPETHWIVRYHKKLTRKTAEAWVTPKLLPKLFAYPRFPALGLGREEVEKLLDPETPVPYARFVSGIFELYGKARGKPLVGDKTPGYCRHVPVLHGLWPQAKFIHLIRDGRDVCLSAIYWKKPGKLLSRSPTWGEDRVTTAALWWAWHVRMGREAGSLLGDDLYREVRYESVVARPEEECAKLCAFLGAPYDEAMVRFHEGRTRTEPGLDAKEAWLPITAGLRDWRSQMSPADVQRFEAAAGGLLDELGYPRAEKRPSPAARDHALRAHDAFTRGARSQGHSLPEHW